MQSRIYFLLLVLAAVSIAIYQNGRIATLHQENSALRQMLDAQDRTGYDNTAPAVLEKDQPEKELTVVTPDPYTATQLEEKIIFMEAQLKRYRDETDAYQSMIGALKDEISIRERELQDMHARFAQYETHNETFIHRLTEKEQDLEAAIESVRERRQQTTLLGEKVKELSKSLSLAEADACYARARLTEIAGNKIFFSRERKREYFREALEGYRKAFSLGKEEARENISRLEKSLFPALATVQ